MYSDRIEAGHVLAGALQKFPKEKVLIPAIRPQTPVGFMGVSNFYDNFDQVIDEEVLFCLNQLRAEQTNSGSR